MKIKHNFYLKSKIFKLAQSIQIKKQKLSDFFRQPDFYLNIMLYVLFLTF